MNVVNPTVIFIGVTVILDVHALEVNGKGCSRVLQMLGYLSGSEQQVYQFQCLMFGSR